MASCCGRSADRADHGNKRCADLRIRNYGLCVSFRCFASASIQRSWLKVPSNDVQACRPFGVGVGRLAPLASRTGDECKAIVKQNTEGSDNHHFDFSHDISITPTNHGVTRITVTRCRAAGVIRCHLAGGWVKADRCACRISDCKYSIIAALAGA